MVDPSATLAQAPVITVIIDSADADGPRALFELVEAATRTDSKGLAAQRGCVSACVHRRPKRADRPAHLVGQHAVVEQRDVRQLGQRIAIGGRVTED